MQATIPSASDRKPIDFKKGLTKTEPSSPPKVYTAKEAAGQLADHVAAQYPPGEVPDSIKLARARAAGVQPVHEDPFNPTPEDAVQHQPQPIQPQPMKQLASQPLYQIPVQQTRQAVAPPPVSQQVVPPPPQMAVPLSVAQQQAAQTVTPIQPQQVQPQVPDEVSEFLDARIRVTLTLQDGTFSMPATAIRETSLAVFVFFPDTPNSVTFVPKPGTQLQISIQKGGEFQSWDVYYPGTYVSVGELAQTVVAFIKAED